MDNKKKTFEKKNIEALNNMQTTITSGSGSNATPTDKQTSKK
jgi:hypothetical protein